LFDNKHFKDDLTLICYALNAPRKCPIYLCTKF
jgi:hypothetical protein